MKENEDLVKWTNETKTREHHTPGLKGSKGKNKILEKGSEEDVDEISATAGLIERFKPHPV